MTPQQLLTVAQQVATWYPEADLVKNQVGNLSVVNAGQYVGFIDLATGEFEGFEGEEPA
jgi:hypothetical protein